jgi:hypothetical protein
VHENEYEYEDEYEDEHVHVHETWDLRAPARGGRTE